MAHVDRASEHRFDALDACDPEDRAWLADRLEEHAELLEYLHDH